MKAEACVVATRSGLLLALKSCTLLSTNTVLPSCVGLQSRTSLQYDDKIRDVGNVKLGEWNLRSVPDFKLPHVDYAALSQGGCFTMITLSHDCLQYRWLIIDQCADISTVLCFVHLEQVFGSTRQCPCDGCGCSSSHCKSQDYSLAVLTVGIPWGLPRHQQCPRWENTHKSCSPQMPLLFEFSSSFCSALLPNGLLPALCQTASWGGGAQKKGRGYWQAF